MSLHGLKDKSSELNELIGEKELALHTEFEELDFDGMNLDVQDNLILGAGNDF